MPEAQDEDRGIGDFVAQLVIADDDPSDLAWRVGVEFLADLGMVVQPIRRVGKLACYTRRRRGGAGMQMAVQPHKIGGGFVRPFDFHADGGRRGLPVARLSAHA